MLSYSLLSALFGLAAAVPAPQARAANPIQISSSSFLGYRNASNDQTIRDLGYMGNIGSNYILTFGDGTGSTNATTRANLNCAYITARDGAGIPSSNPLSYSDVNTYVINGLCNNVPQMARFCPELAGEDDSSGLGLTNIVGINSTTGVLYTLPTTCSNNVCVPQGAGLAVVTLNSQGTPVCTRPYGVHTWSQNEPTWGQLGAILGQDGYIYVYANGRDTTDNIKNNTVVLARVLPSRAFDRSAYQYWHGTAAGFTSTPILLSNLDANSPENLGFFAAQGSIFYSTYYKQYVYLNPYFSIFAQTASSPQGPWSSGTLVYAPPKVYSLLYAPVIQPKYFSSDGKSIVVGWSDDGYQGMARVNFA